MKDLRVEYRRGGRVESVHRVAAAVVEGRKLLGSWDAVGVPVFMRSCAKPIQALAVVGSGAADAFGLSPEELAVVCGSHGGEPEQVAAAASVLAKAGVKPEALRCGAHVPSSPRGARELARQGLEPTPLHNNCSGKHSGMLAAAKKLGAPLETYLDPAHPLQRLNLANVSELAGVPAKKIPLGTDGCSAPTFGIPVRAMARAISAVANSDGAPRRIREAMMAHPSMVGHPCVKLMSCAPGRIVGKGGAEGVYLCGLPDSGAGIALKVADGNLRPAMHVLAALVRKFRLLKAADLERLEALADPILRNHAGLAVGEIRVRL